MKMRYAVLIFVIILAVTGYNILGRLYPLKYNEEVKRCAAEFEVDPLLITAVIKAESNFDEDVTSAKNARGLMQLTDDTAKWCAEKMKLTDFSPDSIYSPELNIRLGTYYFSYLLERYNGNVSNASAAYNAGMGNADKWLMDKSYCSDGIEIDKTPFNETNTYINKIKYNYKIYKILY